MRSLTSLRGESASVPPTATGLSRYGDEPEEEEEEEEEEEIDRGAPSRLFDLLKREGICFIMEAFLDL